jgi:hypothetical protein
MFEGEFESLSALEKTGCIRVPKPLKALSRPGVGFYQTLLRAQKFPDIFFRPRL